MTKFDGEEFGRNIVEAVNASIERSMTPLIKRIEALETINIKAMIAEAIAAIPIPQDGKSVTVDDVRPMLAEMVKESGDELEQALSVMVDKAVAAIPPAKDGKDADPIDMEAVRTMIVEECKDVRAALEQTIGPEMQEALAVQVAEAVKAIPVPEIPPLPDIAGMIKEAVEAIPMPPAPDIPDIPALIKEAVEALPAPRDGKDAEPVDVEALKIAITEDVKAFIPDVAGMVAEAVQAIPPAKDGKDAESVDVEALKIAITEDVKAFIPPAPQLPDIDGMIDAAVTKAVGEIKIEVPDIGPHVEEVNERVKEAVEGYQREAFEEIRRKFESLPAPRDGRDGKSITVDDVRPLIDDVVSKAVAAIPVPKDGRDGADVMDAVVSKDGHLVLTFSDGRTKDVGRVVGNDGLDVDIDRVQQQMHAMFDAVPKPKDGMGFDDMTVEHDGERTFKFVLSRGDERKEFEFIVPVVLDRGVYAEGKTYQRGDSVSWGGSMWIAQVDGATKKPGEGNSEWRLAVKRGKTGKDGAASIPRPNVPVQLGV